MRAPWAGTCTARGPGLPCRQKGRPQGSFTLQHQALSYQPRTRSGASHTGQALDYPQGGPTPTVPIFLALGGDLGTWLSKTFSEETDATYLARVENISPLVKDELTRAPEGE